MNSINTTEINQFFIVPKIIFIVLTGLVLPLLLIPLIKFIPIPKSLVGGFTGYSEIAEEIAKAGVVLFLILALPSIKEKIGTGILFGFLFGVSENIFYLNNIFQLGDFTIFWQRFLWTVPMHIITVLVILLCVLKNKKLIVLGLAGAIVIHLLFNNFIAL